MEDVNERIKRAHQKAVDELVEYLGKHEDLKPCRENLREYYCNSFRMEAFRNWHGIKEYDNELLSKLLPRVIREFGSSEIDEFVDLAILRYHQETTNKKIILRSAMAILSSKFPKEYLERFEIEACKDSMIRISRTTRRRNYCGIMDLMTLASEIKKVSKIEQLLTRS